MLAIERRKEIQKKLEAEKRVLVGELAALFGVTEETVRRDLAKLEREGKIERTYGGAVLPTEKTELSHSVRKKTNVTAKQKIARLTAKLVNDGDHVMLDDSSTAYFAAKELREKKNLTVITNSIEIILVLSDVPGWSIIATGGTLREESLAMVGPRAEQMMRGFHVDKAIISCKGLSLAHGFMDSGEQSAQVKKAMMAAARQTILAVDHTKLGRESFVQIGILAELSAVVTDQDPGPDWLRTLDTHGIQTLFSGKSERECKEDFHEI